MVEGALTFPLMVLVTLALVNLALAGYASVTAYDAARDALRAGVGTYRVQVEQADGFAGGRVAVQVSWQVPNFFAGLMPLFGASVGPIEGKAHSVFRKEGW